MNRLLIYFLFFTSIAVYAQECPEIMDVENVYKTKLDINEISAPFNADGTMFWDLQTNSGFEVPKESGTGTIFAASLWIGGYDEEDNLVLAAQTYRQSGADFFHGPLDQNDESNCKARASWNKIWKTDRACVKTFLDDWNDNGELDNPVPDCVLDYPARGNQYVVFNEDGNGYDDDFDGITADAAPFFDANGDDIYDPYVGDYPLVKGDQQLWWVLNDQDVHTETGGNPLGVEIQATAYAYQSEEDAYVKNTFYINYKIINKGSKSLSEIYFSSFNDIDIGGYLDDFIGCDTLTNSIYGYNGDSKDEDGLGNEGSLGYGESPPIQIISFAKTPVDENGEELGMTVARYYNNDFTNIGNPVSAEDHYEYMTGLWKDGTPMTYGGNGYGGEELTTFVYPSEPSDPTGWSECTTGNIPNERRGLLSTGPFRIEPNESTELTLSFYTHFNENLHCGDSIVDHFFPTEIIETGQQLWENDEIPTTSLELNQMTAIESGELQGLRLYPNPSIDELNIELETGEMTAVVLYNLEGKEIVQQTFAPSYQYQLNISDFASGLYLLEIQLKDGPIIRKKVSLGGR